MHCCVICDDQHIEPLRVGPLPTIAYVPDYLTSAEEASLLCEIRGARRWTKVSGRRLQTHGGTVHERKGLLQTPLPAWLSRLTRRLAADTAVYGVEADGRRPKEPNHVLINAYTAGQGIMHAKAGWEAPAQAHQDGPAYWPGVCIVSLGAPAVMRFRSKAIGTGAGASSAGLIVTSLVLQPRSLLIFENEAYTTHLHGIDETSVDTVDGTVYNAEACGLRHGDVIVREGERISLTVRRVERAMSQLLRL